MKTVQETLNEIDEKKLIDDYIYTYPISVDDFDDDITVGDVKTYTKSRLHEYLDRLKKMTIKDSSDPCVFFIHRTMKDGMGDVIPDIVSIKDLKEKGVNAYGLAYEFTPQAEILGWQIADNKLTQDNLTEILIDIMFEASFFGFEQEGLEKEINILKSRMNEVEQDKDVKKTLTWKDFKKEFIDLYDTQTAEEKKLENKASLAEMNYSECSRKKELQEIIADLGIKN